MKESWFTESQIVSVLKQVNPGAKVEDVWWECGISYAAKCNWKSKHGDIDIEVSDLRCVRELEEENVRLKTMFAHLSFIHEATKDLI